MDHSKSAAAAPLPDASFHPTIVLRFMDPKFNGLEMPLRGLMPVPGQIVTCEHGQFELGRGWPAEVRGNDLVQFIPAYGNGTSTGQLEFAGKIGQEVLAECGKQKTAAKCGD